MSGRGSPFMDVQSFGGSEIYYQRWLPSFKERRSSGHLKNTKNVKEKILLRNIVIATVLLHFAVGSNALILELCKTPLGMESGDILDGQITASSSYEVSVTGPTSARLNVDHLGGAWCPKGMVGEEGTKHFLEINLKKVHVISAAVTQGRFGNGRGVEYVEYYLLEYWREGFKEWKTYKLYNGRKILKGNTNAYTAVTMELMPPIFASKIRFVPHASHPRTVCMRVEIIGCLYADGVLSYAMPQGEERGQDLELIDANYDGEVKDNYLKEGLGQLTDGIIGESNFRANLTRGRGYEWIGWKNDSIQHLEVIFRFDSLRNFTAMYIYTNNMFSKDVQVFSRARVWFGLDGSVFNPKPIDYFYMKDEASEYSRNVSIVLRGRVARNLKLQLYFSSRWIMISEIYFLSFPVHENGSSINYPFNADGAVYGLGSNRAGVAGNREVYNDVSDSVRDDFQAPDLRLHKVTDSEADEKRQQLIAIIIGILVAVILLLVGAIFYFFWNTKRHKMMCLPQDLFHGPFGHKQEIIGTENDADVMKNGIYTEPFQATYRGSSFSTATATHRVNHSLRMSSPEYTEYASTDYAVPHEFQRNEYSSQRSTSPYFSSFLGKVVPANESPLHQSVKSSLSTNNNLHYSRTMQEDLEDSYGHSQINIHINDKVPYGDDSEDDSNKPEIEEVDSGFPPEIPKHKITVIRKLGEGVFGEVHLGEVEDGDGVKRLVAIKSLRMESSFDIRSSFEREVTILARLQNRNIVRVLGVITTEEPLCMLSEYGKRGDLNHFLQGHVASTTSTRATNAKTISYGCLIYMATQIASGMKYLESLNFVHRDLATRNCLVCNDYSIKISDFGISRQVHRGDYFLTETNILMPVRWMAWESILLGKYTTKSDVWAFGVTLWEVLTMVRERPYEDLTDKEVIDNANYFYQAGQRKETLFQPPNCPKEIYDLMKECWKHSEMDRPSFKEIHMFLQRKNLGYSLSL